MHVLLFEKFRVVLNHAVVKLVNQLIIDGVFQDYESISVEIPQALLYRPGFRLSGVEFFVTESDNNRIVSMFLNVWNQCAVHIS
jgi:hypothetical protein